jgi:hypothetical protein
MDNMMKKTKHEFIATAVQSLRPGVGNWSLEGETYEGLTWFDPDILAPTKEELFAEVQRLEQEYDKTEYQRLREKEYPPITDYLDAVVKGDLAQQQAYIDACLAVKAKYPKPEGA